MKSILMTPDNIKATTDGRKTQTRRIESGLKEINKESDAWESTGWAGSWGGYAFEHKPRNIKTVICKPRYNAGETVYLKEAYYTYGYWYSRTNHKKGKTEFVFERCDDKVWFPDNKPSDLLISRGRKINSMGWYLRSPLFMFAKDARCFRKIKTVRPERLLDITKNQNDAIAEGMIFMGGMADNWDEAPWAAPDDKEQLPQKYPSAAYLYEWDLINGKDSYKLNLWVWRYEFEVKK